LKRKGSVLFAVLIFSLFLLTPQVFAEETEDVKRFSQSDILYSNLPDGIEKEEIEELLEEKNTGKLFENLISQLVSYFTFGLGDAIRFLGGLLVIVFTGALFQAIKKSFASLLIQDAFDLIFLLVLAVFSYRTLENTFTLAKNALISLHDFMLFSLPVTGILDLMGGSVQTAAARSTNLNLVLTLVSGFVSHALFPLLRFLFVFCVIECFTDINLQNLMKFFKKSVRVICVFFFSLVSAILAIQNALGTAADSLSMRTVRFAAGNFIPVVGPLLGENAKTLKSSLNLVRTECGILCLVVLAFVILQPIITILIQKFVLSLSAAIGQMLGESKTNRFFASISGLLDLLNALLISQGCYLIFYITLFLQNKGSY